MQDYKALANALIDALKNSTEAGLNQLNSQRRFFAEDINNRGAKRGTLYSTAGANQRSRYDATTFLPGQAQIRSNQQQQTMKIQGDVISTQQKIDSINRAANELNAIDDNYFNSLLV